MRTCHKHLGLDCGICFMPFEAVVFMYCSHNSLQVCLSISLGEHSGQSISHIIICLKCSRMNKRKRKKASSIYIYTAASENAGRATWPITDQEGANVLATICLHTQTCGNVSPSCGRLPGTTLASALKSRSCPGVRLDLHLSGYWWIKQIIMEKLASIKSSWSNPRR